VSIAVIQEGPGGSTKETEAGGERRKDGQKGPYLPCAEVDHGLDSEDVAWLDKALRLCAVKKMN